MRSTNDRSWLHVVAGLVAIVATLAVATSTAFAERQVVDRIVAQVNDEIITLYELEEGALPYLVEMGENPRALQDEQRRDEILEEVLEDKIEGILLEEEAAEQGLEIAESQIDEWIEMTAQQQGMTRQQFRQAIAQYGIEHEEYRDIIRDNLLRMQLVQQQAGGGARVSDEEVDEVYRERYGGEEGVQQELEVRHILLVPDQLEGGEQEARERLGEFRQQILEGEATFAEIAETYSQGPGAEDGGNIGTFGPGELDPSFEEVIFEQEVGEISQPVATDFGVHLIEVLDRREAEDPQVEQRRQQIRAELQERQMEQEMESYLETLRTRAYIDVRY